MNKFFASATTAVIASALVLVGTQSAQAAVTPGALVSGSKIFALECDDNVTNDLLAVDPSTGQTTVVGSSGQDGCWSGAVFNPVDDKIYALDMNDWEEPYTLFSFDPTTGAATEIANLPAGVSGAAMAIGTDGSAYLIDWEDDLYSIDLTDASTTLIGNMAFAGEVYSFAINPVDGRAYVLEWNGDWKFGEVDLSDGTYTNITTNYRTLIEAGNAGLAFDSNGTAWLQVEQNTAELWSADINDLEGTAQYESQYFNPDDATDPIYTEAIAIAYGLAPAGLADTGISSEQLGATAALAFATLAGGVTILAYRRRTNRL